MRAKFINIRLSDAEYYLIIEKYPKPGDLRDFIINSINENISPLPVSDILERLSALEAKKERKTINKKDTEKEKPVNQYFDNVELNKAFLEYLEMRVRIKKPATERAIELAIKKLNNLAPENDINKILILEQSTLNNYQDLYNLKNNIHATNKTDNSVQQNFVERASKNSY